MTLTSCVICINKGAERLERCEAAQDPQQLLIVYNGSFRCLEVFMSLLTAVSWQYVWHFIGP